MKNLIYTLLWVVLAIVGVGCTTYVNIPAQTGDLATHNPNDLTVRTILGEALSKVAKEYPFEGSFAILLPEQTTDTTYREVASMVGSQALWPGNPERSDLPTLEVKRIAIRRQEARVDIIRPTDHGQPDSRLQLITATLHWHPMKGWVVQRLRPWRISIEQALARTIDESE